LYHFCVTVSVISSNGKRKEKDITTLKAAIHSEMQKWWEFYICDGFTFTTKVPKTYATLKTKMKQI
jgi:hypothetical protein